MKLYRRRVWTCKVSGKMNLTYEEALVSERKATEKVQQFPKEFMGPVLRMVQFSMFLPLTPVPLLVVVRKHVKFVRQDSRSLAIRHLLIFFGHQQERFIRCFCPCGILRAHPHLSIYLFTYLSTHMNSHHDPHIRDSHEPATR